MRARDIHTMCLVESQFMYIYFLFYLEVPGYAVN